MSIRRIECQSIETNRPGVILTVSVRYDAGDSRRERGYYVFVTYIEIRDGMKYAVIGKGGHGLLRSATRFSARHLEELADAAGLENEALTQIVDRVLERNGLQRIYSELAEPVCA